MDRSEECVCCFETPQVQSKITEVFGEVRTCITRHPGFQAVCLNKWVLETARYQYRQQYTDYYNGPEHKEMRHIAYRQLARWCWGFLGYRVRVVLPSCAVSNIRACFPPPGLEENFQYEGFHYMYADD